MGTGLVNGATSAKGSGHLTAQPDAASGSGWPAGGWRPGALQRQAWRDRLLPPVDPPAPLLPPAPPVPVLPQLDELAVTVVAALNDAESVE